MVRPAVGIKFFESVQYTHPRLKMIFSFIQMSSRIKCLPTVDVNLNNIFEKSLDDFDFSSQIRSTRRI